jgi:hypothetical protein
MFRRIQVALAAVSILLVTSGCMKVNMDLTVNKNDTVSGSVIIAFSNDAIDLAKSMGSESALSTDSLIKEQPGIKVEPFLDAEYQGSKVTFEERPFDEFSTGTDADSLNFTRNGNIISVTGAIDMAGDDPTLIDQVRTNPITSGLFAKSDISVSITMPGKLTSKTGVISGNTVTFKGELGDNIIIDVQADDSLVFDPLAIGAGVVVLAGAAAVGVLLMNRRKTAVQTNTSTQAQDNEW